MAPWLERLVKSGQRKGYLTYTQVNRLLPRDAVEASLANLDLLFDALEENGIDLFDADEPRIYARDFRYTVAREFVHWFLRSLMREGDVFWKYVTDVTCLLEQEVGIALVRNRRVIAVHVQRGGRIPYGPG